MAAVRRLPGLFRSPIPKKPLLQGQHCGKAVVIGMVPAQQVQQAMAHQPAQFPLKAVPLLLGLTPGRLQGDDDVPQFDAGAFHPVAGVVEGGKGQHVRGACFLAPGAVQVRDIGVIGEN